MNEGKNLTKTTVEGNTEETKKLEKDWEILQQIIKILKEMGFATCDRFLNNKKWFEETWKDAIPFPLVDDEGNGIRVSVSKRQKFIVWFTNGFEEPECPRRQEVVREMVTRGFGDNVNKLGYTT